VHPVGSYGMKKPSFCYFNWLFECLTHKSQIPALRKAQTYTLQFTWLQ